MKYIDEFIDPEIIKKLTEIISKDMARIGRPVRLMEVCGTHTMSIGKAGIRSLLPENLKLLSGPGCPVCVTPAEYITESVRLAQLKETIITTFGDMVRVPNSKGESLEAFSSSKVRIVYSPLDALDIARDNPDNSVIFLGVGFETTAPLVGHTIRIAKREKIPNFFCLSSHKLIPPAIKALTASSDSKIDGFILPGHVSVIIGRNAYHGLDIRGVVTGFEPTDILQGINMLLVQIKEGRMAVENQYTRAVTDSGNTQMQEVMSDVFCRTDSKWRGLSVIPESGLEINPEYSPFNAQEKFKIDFKAEENPSGCRCGEVLQGICVPPECSLFGKSCTLENPVGPCMVSSEGSCSAYYKYER